MDIALTLLPLYVVAIVAIVLAFEIWMFVDACRNPRLPQNERVLWLIGMVLIHPVVAVVYFVIYRLKPGQPS